MPIAAMFLLSLFSQRNTILYQPYQTQEMRDSKSHRHSNYRLVSLYGMPEIGLGIGRCVLPSDRFSREVLSRFDQKGDRYLTANEQVDLERQRADEAQKQVESLMAKLRSLLLTNDRNAQLKPINILVIYSYF